MNSNKLGLEKQSEIQVIKTEITYFLLVAHEML